MDEQVDGCGRSNGGGGGRGRSGGLSVSDHLRTIISFGFSQCLGGSTLVSTMSLFATAEAKSFLDTSGTIGRGEFSKANCVHLHGIGVGGWGGIGGKGRKW